MKSRSEVKHDGLGISSSVVRELYSIPQLLQFQEGVYSDVMDMNLKENEVKYKMDSADPNEFQELKHNLGQLSYKKQLYSILLEQIKLRIEIVKVSNIMEECQLFQEISKDYISPNVYHKICEEAKKKLNDQIASN